MNNTDILTLYHGSDKPLPAPYYGGVGVNNDFGRGFYCTEDKHLACEWAVTSQRDGYCNTYHLNTLGLSQLDINTPDFTVLNWVATLLYNRKLDPTVPGTEAAKDYLISTYSIDLTGYDIITGYRADDAYYGYIRDFLTNSITVNQLAEALLLGNLGEQIVLTSPQAFNQLDFVDVAPVSRNDYYPAREHRSNTAYQSYLQLLKQHQPGLTIYGLMEHNIGGDDERIPRNVPLHS